MSDPELAAQKEVYSDLLQKSQAGLKNMLEVNYGLLDMNKRLAQELDESKRFNRESIQDMKQECDSLLKEYGINNISIPIKKENPLKIIKGGGEDEPET